VLKPLPIGLIGSPQLALRDLQLGQVMGRQENRVAVIHLPTDARRRGQVAAGCVQIAAEPEGLAQVPGGIRAGHVFLGQIFKRLARQRDGARQISSDECNGGADGGDPAKDFGRSGRPTRRRLLRGKVSHRGIDRKPALELLQMPFGGVMLPIDEQQPCLP
jgi:hypothetical protein